MKGGSQSINQSSTSQAVKGYLYTHLSLTVFFRAHGLQYITLQSNPLHRTCFNQYQACTIICPHTHRETLLGQLSGYVRSVRDDFTSRSSSGPAHHQRRPADPAQAAAAEKQAPPTGKNMPEVVNNIVWTQQLEAKV